MDAQRWDDTEVWIRKLVTLQLKRSPWAVLMLEQLCSCACQGCTLYMGNTYFNWRNSGLLGLSHGCSVHFLWYSAQRCCCYCIVCWGVIVVSSCPLEGDTCAAIITNWALRPRPPIHPSLCSTVALFWLFVNETWLLGCPIWWRHGTIENAVFSYPRCPIWWQRQKTKSQLHETNGFWVQIIQSGPWDQILGSSGSNVIQHCGQSTRESSHLRISSLVNLFVPTYKWKQNMDFGFRALWLKLTSSQDRDGLGQKATINKCLVSAWENWE